MKGILSSDVCFSTIKHKVGQAFNTDGIDRDTIDLGEARKIFDFEIKKFGSFTEDGRALPKTFHLRRGDNDQIIPTRGLGQEFKPIQHLEVFDYLCNDIVPEMERLGKNVEFETVGTMNNGGTGIAMMKINENFNISGDMSPHETRLFWFNPNGKDSMLLGSTNVRLWCQNQLPAAIGSAKKAAKHGNGMRVSHTTHCSARVQEAVATIFDRLYDADLMFKREQRLAELKATEANLMHLLNRFIPMNGVEPGTRGYTIRQNKRAEIVYQWHEGDTAKSFDGDSGAKLFNCFSYVTYNPSSIGVETDLAAITYSGTAGSRGQKVVEIFRAVEEELGVR